MPETGFDWSSSFNSCVMSSISSFWETPVPHILKTETCWVSSKQHFLFLLPEAKWSGLDSWCFCSAFVPILGLSPVQGLYHVHNLYVHLEKGFNNQCSFHGMWIPTHIFVENFLDHWNQWNATGVQDASASFQEFTPDSVLTLGGIPEEIFFCGVLKTGEPNSWMVSWNIPT